MPFEVYSTLRKSADGTETQEWRWRLKAANGEIVASSEAYSTKHNAQRGADDARSAALLSEPKSTEADGNGD